MNFKHFSLPSCFVRTKGSAKGDLQSQAEQLSQRLPDAPQHRGRSPPPKPPLIPYEHPPASETPSMSTQLPVEIILLIVESSGLLQRARVMLTCRYFHQLLEPTLYRHLNLLDPDIYRRIGPLHQALYDRPALISQIVTYHGPIFPPERDEAANGFLPWINIPQDPRWSVGLTVFQMAVNIRDLHFTGYYNWIGARMWAPHRKAVDDMVLDRLVIQVPDESVDLVPLLRNQPELTRLELLEGGRGWDNLETTDIPKLKSLSATLQIAASIVPGRPVSAIKLLPSRVATRLEEGLLQNLNMSTQPIRHFETTLRSSFKEDSVRDQLQTLARNLPAIEDLTFRVGGKISGRILLLEIPAFGSISSLTLLEANLVHAASLTIFNEDFPRSKDKLLVPTDTWADLETQLKERCPNFVSLNHTACRGSKRVARRFSGARANIEW